MSSSSSRSRKSSSKYSSEVVAEEWEIRYRQFQEALCLTDKSESTLQQQQQKQQKNPSEAGENETNPLWKRQASQCMVLRAGRLGAWQQQAYSSNKHSNKENHLIAKQLLDHAQSQMDHNNMMPKKTSTSSQPSQRPLLDRLVSAQLPFSVTGTDLPRPTFAELSLPVDAFWEEYPECIRPDWNEIHGSDSDAMDEDDSSSSDTDAPQHVNSRDASGQRKKSRTGTNAALSEPSRPSMVSDTQQPSHGTMAQTNTRNPYQKKTESQQNPTPASAQPPRTASATTIPDVHRPPDSNGNAAPFSYTPPSAYADEEPKETTNVASSWNNHPQTTAVASRSSGTYYPPRPPATTAASWDEYAAQQPQTNPFQTAREVAQNMRDSEHSNSRNNNHSYNQQQQQPPPQRQQQQQPYHNPYHMPHQNYAPDNGDPNDQAPARGGPMIPNSLRRKFQPPKRVEPTTSNGKRPSGFAPSAKGGVQLTRPSGRHSKAASGGNVAANTSSNTAKKETSGNEEDDELPEELQHLDKELVKKIQHEIMESGDTITFDDIAGLDDAKQTVQEVVCWPMKRPDLFTGLRRAPNGLLLYGPPGTGKTLIGKAIAHESGATFFSISSSSLTSKWIGEGEKLVKTLFAVAAYNEPAVVFIDEMDSLLTQRTANENEASRRIKTEFLVQLDGTGTSGQGRVLVIGATNKPQELDEAARRRFTKRLYIPLPTEPDRKALLYVMLHKNNHQLTDRDVDRLARETDGFSGADLKALCTDAAMGPIRQLGAKALEVNLKDVPPITYKHFKRSLKGTKPSVAPTDLVQYEEWDKVYGTKRASEDEDDDEDEDDEAQQD